MMFRRFATCRRGASAVEAAIVFPVLIALLLGTIEFSFVLYTNNALQTAAREVARQLAVNYIPPAGAAAEIADRLPPWVGDGAEVTVAQSAPADPATNLMTVEITLPVADATPINLFNHLVGGMTLNTAVTMKQELPL